LSKKQNSGQYQKTFIIQELLFLNELPLDHTTDDQCHSSIKMYHFWHQNLLPRQK